MIHEVQETPDGVVLVRAEGAVAQILARQPARIVVLVRGDERT